MQSPGYARIIADAEADCTPQTNLFVCREPGSFHIRQCQAFIQKLRAKHAFKNLGARGCILVRL